MKKILNDLKEKIEQFEKNEIDALEKNIETALKDYCNEELTLDGAKNNILQYFSFYLQDIAKTINPFEV